MHPPKIFISATSGDLRSIRQLVKEALLTIDCHPVEQTNFEPDARTVANMLRGKIGECQALVHICGIRYGAEPDPATLPPGAPRRSYTQLEYHLGRQIQDERGDDHFRVYTFICPENFPYDPVPDTEPQEKRDLQRAHRTRLFDDPHLWESPQHRDDLRARIIALQEPVLALKQEQAEVKAELLKSRHIGLKAFAVLLLLLGGICGIQMWLKRNQESTEIRIGHIQSDLRLLMEKNGIEVNAPQTLADAATSTLIDAQSIRARLTEASLIMLDADRDNADKATDAISRQRLREVAEAENQARLARLDDLTVGIQKLQFQSSEMNEMTRIIEEEGVDAALAYSDHVSKDILRRIQSLPRSQHEKAQQMLLPLLKAAQLQQADGRLEAALESFKTILALEPDWSEAIESLGDLFSTRGNSSDLTEAIRLFTHSLGVRESQANLEKTSRRWVAVNLAKLSDVYVRRGDQGDEKQALEMCMRSLEICETIYHADPDSTEAARDVSVSLNKLGDFLANRGQPGDAEKALAHYQRSNEVREKLLAANPDSAEAARDVSISLTKLGYVLAKRGGQGDEETALAHFQRNLEICEKLLTANPDSAQAARDVVVSHYKLASYAEGRGDAAGKTKHRRACYDILAPRIARGVTFDPPILRVFEALKQEFGGK